MLVGIGAVTAQILIAIAALLAVAGASADGLRLLIPLTPDARSTLAPTALRLGSALVANGPVAGSLIVAQGGPSLGWAMLSQGIIAIPAPVGGCSEDRR